MKKEEGLSDNSFGVSSVILGIVSLSFIPLTILAFFAPISGLILGIVSLFFALNQRKRNKNNWAKYGLILAILGIIINLVILFGFISFLNNISDQYQMLCDAAGGCENIPTYIQSQQVAGY